MLFFYLGKMPALKFGKLTALDVGKVQCPPLDKNYKM